MSNAWGPIERGVRRVAPALGLTLVFLAASVLGFVFHLDTAPGRRLVARATNSLVSELLVSDLRIERIDVLSPATLRVSRAVLLDRSGKPVMAAEGLEARFGLVELLRGILAADAVRVRISDVTVERFTFALLRDRERGGFSIETAFDPMPSGPRTTPPKPVFVALPRIRVASADVTTDQPGVERVTARVRELSASLDVSPAGLVLALKSGDATIRELFARDVRARLDSELRLPGTTRATLDAHVGGAPLTGTLAWQKKELDLGLRSARLEPASLRELFGAWPLIVPLAASARATGELSTMKASTEANIGACRISGSGALELAPEVRSELAVRVEDFDLRSLDAVLPQTALDVDATVKLRYANGFEVETVGTFRESTVGGYAVPALRVRATYARSGLSGTATILEPKLATNAEFRVSDAGRVEFETKSEDVELAALARYGLSAEGRATLRSRGVLEAGRLDATFEGSFREPRVGGVSAENVRVRARVEGALANPGGLSVDLVTEGERLDAAGATLRRFRATARGSALRPKVTLEDASDDDTKLAASADVELGKRLVLREVRLESRRGDDAVSVEAGRVEVGPGGVAVRDVSLRSGDGSMNGSVTFDGRRRVVDLTLHELDVRRVAAALGVPAPAARGRIDGRVRFEELGSERTGEAELTLRDGAYPPVRDVSIDLKAKLAGPDIEADATVALSGVGRGELRGRGTLRRSVFAPRAFDALSGRATLDVAELDVATSSRPWLEGTGVSLRGQAALTVSAARPESSSVPVVSYRVKTQGLVVSRAAQGAEAPSEIRLDVDSDGELLHPNGSRVALELSDVEGPWISAVVEHALPGDAVLRASRADLGRAILDAPIRANLKAFGRPLRVFGAGAASVERSVSGTVNATGTARKPELEVRGRVSGTGSTAAQRDAGRIDVMLRYSAEREAYELAAHTAGERDRIELSSSGRFGWLDRGFGSDWSAKGEVRLARFGLAPAGQLLDAAVLGETSGTIRFDVDRHEIEALGELALDSVAIERHQLGSGSARLKIARGQAEAMLDIGSRRSRLELAGEAGITWSEKGPELDTKRGGRLGVTARSFELAALRPLVQSVLTRLGGTLNGHAELGWATKAGGKRSTTLRANATVTDGSVSLAAGGGLIQKVHARALSEGGGALRVEFSGAARSRKPNVEGKATLTLDGPNLKRLDAELGLEAFPLIYDGVLMGRATSGARTPLGVAVVPTDDGQTIDVHVPAVDIALPKSSDQSLIALDEDPSVVVTDESVDPELLRRAGGRSGTTTLRVHLGNKVRIQRGNLEVPVAGAMTVHPDGRLSGTIRFPQGGVVPAFGQTFRIRRGVVSFANAEVKDGALAIQAWARVADGTLIEVDVSGTLGEPDINFQSDPPRSDEEIISLLLGIQTDSTVSDENEHLKNTAVALAMNRIVQDSMLSGLQFGAGETNTGDSVSTVTMRVGSKVWVEGRTVYGSQTSVNPETRVSGVVDWRFAPSWSLRTQLGDVSGVEIRWSLRY
ncbi:MAG TPA: translocation/assembly module TamB domain-containing protein [Polyangiaceae bacterium]